MTKKLFGSLIVLFVLLAATQLLSPQVAHAQCGLPGTPPCGEREKKNRPTPTLAPTPIPTATDTAVVIAPIVPPISGKVGHADNAIPGDNMGWIPGDNRTFTVGAIIIVALLGVIVIGRRFQHSGGTHSGGTDNSAIPGDNMGWIPGDNMLGGNDRFDKIENPQWGGAETFGKELPNIDHSGGTDNSAIPGDNMLGHNTFGGAGNSPSAVESNPGPNQLGGAGNAPTAVEGNSLPPPDADLPGPTSLGG
ncbi:MAG TPA: hypothetical protein VIU38_02095 [Anaerolineales bacterium]